MIRFEMRKNIVMRSFVAVTMLLWWGVSACFGQIVSWGDQGDGSYRNPVLNANYPDSDVERYGDKWYMISSTSMFAPGMTILESEDLVNWSFVGHVFPRVTWRTDYDATVMSSRRGGVWAGDLVRHDGEWLCYVVDPEVGLFVSAAKEIVGPWSEPLLMHRAENWTDPCVFFDDTAQRAYLLCHTDTDPGTREYENRIFALSRDGRRLLDSGKVFYRGRMAEAAKMYKKDGYYYVFLSQWEKQGGVNDRKQLVLRSEDPYGPYESRIVLERDNAVGRSCCQGSLLQAPDSSWWYMHQLVQSRDSYEGRPQFLIPVHWEDGWPRLGKDIDGNGVGNTVWHWKKPVAGKEIRKPRTSDSFDGDELSPQWAWYYTPDSSRWSLSASKGFLRMRPVGQLEEGNFLKTPNILSQRKMGRGIDTVTVKIVVSHLSEGLHAGLTVFAGRYHNLGISCRDGRCSIYSDYDGDMRLLGDCNETTVFLRTVMHGARGYFQYSFDGKSFESLPASFDLAPQGFMSTRVGLYCYNNVSAKGFIDVDWFEYVYR